ncbi:MAG: plastocyanin/azurin family copper-binding protein [Halofilum sp. (in: g-proteobacteria)]|nr:plastocyanin/azurin family copper-binding protein [Halofilum sp. (in: g-proteobacteria)]
MRHQRNPVPRQALALVLALAAPAAMAAGDHAGGHGQQEQGGHGHEDSGHGHHGAHGFDFGAAAPNAEPDHTIEIVAHDRMRFEPASVTIEPGQVVRFVVRNRGELQHSFTLGSPQYQRTHEREMQGMAPENMAGHMEGSPNGMVVAPGSTDSLTWRFEAGGPIQFACHIPGHYDAGMKGRVRLQ